MLKDKDMQLSFYIECFKVKDICINITSSFTASIISCVISSANFSPSLSTPNRVSTAAIAVQLDEPSQMLLEWLRFVLES